MRAIILASGHCLYLEIACSILRGGHKPSASHNEHTALAKYLDLTSGDSQETPHQWCFFRMDYHQPIGNTERGVNCDTLSQCHRPKPCTWLCRILRTSSRICAELRYLAAIELMSTGRCTVTHMYCVLVVGASDMRRCSAKVMSVVVSKHSIRSSKKLRHWEGRIGQSFDRTSFKKGLSINLYPSSMSKFDF
jgi:hypothetical protein